MNARAEWPAPLPTAPASPPPLPVKLLAGVCGMLGFWLSYQWLAGSDFQPLPLPAYRSESRDALLAAPAALAGAALGLTYQWLHHGVPRLWTRISARPTVHILLGSAVFAGMAAAVPLLRFSGHHEIEHALAHSAQHGIALGVWALLGLSLAKMLAVAVCLASDWRGGEVFPALFAATALAGAIHLMLPAVPLTVAIMGAAGALLTACTGKPIGVLLVMLLLSGAAAPGALLTGVLTGMGARLWQQRSP